MCGGWCMWVIFCRTSTKGWIQRGSERRVWSTQWNAAIYSSLKFIVHGRRLIIAIYHVKLVNGEGNSNTAMCKGELGLNWERLGFHLQLCVSIFFTSSFPLPFLILEPGNLTGVRDWQQTYSSGEGRGKGGRIPGMWISEWWNWWYPRGVCQLVLCVVYVYWWRIIYDLR